VTTPEVQHITIHYNPLQLTAAHITTQRGTSTVRVNAWTATRCNALQLAATHWNSLQRTPPSVYCSVCCLRVLQYVLQYSEGTAIHSNSLQLTATLAATQTADDNAWTATHCNTLQLCTSLRPTATARDNAWTSTYCNTLRLAAIDCITHYNIRRDVNGSWQHLDSPRPAIHCDSLQLTATHTATYAATQGGTSTARNNAWTPQDLQYTATRCNSLQHTLQHTLQHREGRQRLVTTPGLPKTYLKVSLIPIFLYICVSYIHKVNLWLYRFKSKYIYFHMLSRCMQICMCICVYV